MRTLYLRNVPDEVVEGLEYLARSEGMSLSAYAIRRLTTDARRARNAALLDSLPSYDVTVAEIVDDIRAARDER